MKCEMFRGQDPCGTVAVQHVLLFDGIQHVPTAVCSFHDTVTDDPRRTRLGSKPAEKVGQHDLDVPCRHPDGCWATRGCVIGLKPRRTTARPIYRGGAA